MRTGRPTDAYITTSRQESEQIKAQSSMATDGANCLLKITRESKTTQTTSSEDTDLKMDKERTIDE